MKLYVKKEGFKNTRELLLWFFFTTVNSYDVICKGTETYFDKECTQLQCDKNKYRSLDDLYDLCKTYFPGLGIKSLVHYLLTMSFPVKQYGRDVMTHPYFSHCKDMRRIRIFFYSDTYLGDHFESIQFDSKWSWEELFNSMGIQNWNELKSYRNVEMKKYLKNKIIWK